MDKTIRKAVSFEAQKAEEYRYWQSVSGHERAAAAMEMSKEAYRRKGLYRDGQELDRTLVFVRPARS